MEVKEINTKEAIEFIRLTRLESGLISERKDYDEVISLLQQGEKYRQMWEGLEKDIKRREDKCEIACDIVYVSTLNEIKQKYFPKEIIEEVVRGITEQIKEGAEIAKEEASQDEDNNK